MSKNSSAIQCPASVTCQGAAEGTPVSSGPAKAATVLLQITRSGVGCGASHRTNSGGVSPIPGSQADDTPGSASSRSARTRTAHPCSWQCFKAKPATWTRRFGISTPRSHSAIRRSSISPLQRNRTAYAPMDALVNGFKRWDSPPRLIVRSASCSLDRATISIAHHRALGSAGRARQGRRFPSSMGLPVHDGLPGVSSCALRQQASVSHYVSALEVAENADVDVRLAGGLAGLAVVDLGPDQQHVCLEHVVPPAL